jgi:TusA-related sulfurtransferase
MARADTEIDAARPAAAGDAMSAKTESGQDLKPTMTLDMRGTSCPAPLLGAKRLIDAMKPGEVLLLLSDCPGTQDDLFAWSRHTDNHVARTERLPDRGHGYYIQRGRSGGPAANAVLDLRGAVCPGPIVEAKKLLNGMHAGETLKLVSNCPGVAADVGDWVRATGLKLLRTEEIGKGEFEFYIGKP